MSNQSTRLDELAAFHQLTGRLPLSTATDQREKKLAEYMIMDLRQKQRRGVLSEKVRERAAMIPGALDVRPRPNQDAVLAELRDYVAAHGHLPRRGAAATEDERRLTMWIANNTRGDTTRKSPALRARHEALLEILDTHPTWSEHEQDRRIAEVEAFIAEHGHQPALVNAPWLASYRCGQHVAANPFDERIAAILAAPTAVDHEWRVRFEELAAWTRARGGRLPTGWSDGLVFSWLTSQRRSHRKGWLSAEREATLRTLPGTLPALEEPAAA